MSKQVPAITREQVAAFLKPRPRDSHKGLFGMVAVIGGASGMVGAPLIAARAALKLGAGCVHVGLLADGAPIVDATQPELMLHDAHGTLRLVAGQPRPRQGAMLAVGCGMGTSITAQKLLADVLQADVPLVLDADALTLIASDADLQNDVRARKAATILTPHPGEAARLLGITTAEVQSARVPHAQQLAANLRCALVLKGADSVCVTRDGRTFLNNTGNPGMSSAGMGDALAGMIAAFIAQGLGPDEALLLGVHLHGAAADALVEQGITIGMTATEVTDWARWLLNQWI